MNFYLICGALAILASIVIAIFYFLAEAEELETETPQTIEHYFLHPSLFERALFAARRKAIDLEDIEFLDTITFIYRTHGFQAPMTPEAYKRLIELG